MGFDGDEGRGTACEKDRWRAIQADASAHRRTDVLFAAVRVGVFDVVREQPLTAERASGLMGTSMHRTKALLDLLVGYSYLERDGAAYRQPSDLLPLTDPGRPDNLQRRFAYPCHTRSSWAEIETALRNDRCVREWGGLTGRSQQLVADCHATIGSLGYLFMQEIAERVVMPEGARILDIGGGFGDLCRPFLERDESVTAVVFEAPDTVELARCHQQRLGLGQRFETMDGDFERDELPTGFDLVLLSSVLQFYDDGTVLELLRKFAGSLVPGGRLLVREVKIDPDFSGPITGLEFSLHMALNSQRGHAYPAPTMGDLMRRAGCRTVEQIGEGELFYVLLGEL